MAAKRNGFIKDSLSSSSKTGFCCSGGIDPVKVSTAGISFGNGVNYRPAGGRRSKNKQDILGDVQASSKDFCELFPVRGLTRKKRVRYSYYSFLETKQDI
jgi:hypothetical protein